MLDVLGAKKDLLNQQAQNLKDTLAQKLDIDKKDIKLKISAELEFYIIDKEKLTIEHNKIQNIIKNIDESKIFGIESLEEEDGFNQFEVQFIPTDNPVDLAKRVSSFRKFLSEITKADFSAKPFINDAGSSLHFHLSIYYKDINLFSKDHPYDDEEYYYLPLYWSIAGLLEFMLPAVRIFAPTENCYERYLYPKEKKHIHNPTCVCWGFNNRTCAIRIPKKPTEDPDNCRIEHRVSSSASDPYLDMYAILTGVLYGIQNEIECPEPIFGNAFDVVHDDIIALPKTIHEAEKFFQKGCFFVLKDLL